MNISQYIWFIPLIPFIGFLINGLARNILPKTVVSIIGCGTIFISFLLSIFVFNQVSTTSANYHLFDIINIEGLKIPFAFQIDALSSLFLLIITGIGLLIHIYSSAYMHDDGGFAKFFAYLNLFIFFMLLLVLGNNFFIMFIGWEGVGLCSFLLIGFWFKNTEFVAAAKKAFIMNRIGDVGFLLAMFWIFKETQSLEYKIVFSKLATLSTETLTGITLLLFLAATGKSAQLPLFTWLPDAMAGPTPVSALIHAATMVTAGIFMITRCNEIFTLAPFTREIITYVGIFTSLITATIALRQNDIKKVLAYSTVSQLGLMFAGLGVGAYVAAVFHVMTHAFFKALLFLGAGSVIHGMHHEQDITKMGGLKKYMPITHITFLIGCLAIAAIPGFSGFFSKDMILLNLLIHNKIVYVLGIIVSLMTAFYMFRLYALTFLGKLRSHSHSSPLEKSDEVPHESPYSMTIPLIILAFLSIIGGWVGIPALFMENGDRFTTHLSGVVKPIEGGHEISHAIEWMSVVGITLAIIAVILFAIKKYTNKPDAASTGILKFFENKWYVDELYDTIITKPLCFIANFFKQKVEKLGINAMVNRVGEGSEFFGERFTLIQSGNVGLYVLMMVVSIILSIAMFFFLKV